DDRDWPATRALLLCGVAAGPLFVSVFTAEGARRPAYRPARHPVSALSLGPRRWVQVANFAVAGTLYLAGAAGVARTPDPVLSSGLERGVLRAVGVGLLGSAAFTTDPVSGYPPGSPDALTEPTTGMALHGVAALPIFLGIPAAALAHAWRSRRSGNSALARYSAGTAVTMLASINLAGAGFGQAPRLVNLAGLFQRAAIAAGFGWLTALSARALRRERRVTAHE
ncbi:MAG: DUF998 domain-containing protein, partial [Solirubrobacteraceae bacterium]